MKPLGIGIALLAAGLAAALTAARLAGRVRVLGPSMEPALCDGDRVLVESLTYRVGRPRPGDIVLARMRGVSGGLTIKRIAEAGGATHRAPARYVLLGDNAGFSTDSRHLGPVERAAILGRVWYRYWPPERRGRLTHRRACVGRAGAALTPVLDGANPRRHLWHE